MLCAQDYGLAHGVNQAVLHYLKEGQIGAIACLSVSDLWPQSATTLSSCLDHLSGQEKRPLIGSQLSLSLPFVPLTAGFFPAIDGFLPLDEVWISHAVRQCLNEAVIVGELRAQLKRFMAHLGSEPDFLLIDPLINQIGVAAKALNAAMSHFSLEHCPVLVEEPRTSLSAIKAFACRSFVAQQQPWHRKSYKMIASRHDVPDKHLRHHDGAEWLGCVPAFADERLEYMGSFDMQTHLDHSFWLEAEK
ncbi:MAG: ChbG/HpnK family deacetylase [Cohaesibacter sp.]|jgi:predicted glycoside hydrolase/deacetylase ChbG (UPF0249 family)|nr:ChbG/HpnK family deacetylase [Cohaesibacter sp.]